NPIIGVLVLGMLGLNLLRRWYGDKITPHSKLGVGVCGTFAGFSTTISNAAGPIMAIYMQAMGMDKEKLLGTSAWYFFIFNLAKLPIYVVIYLLAPNNPIWTAHTFLFDLLALPAVAVGAYVGRWLVPRMNQKIFDVLVLILAAVAAVKLIV